jgi:hypothetical protein
MAKREIHEAKLTAYENVLVWSQNETITKEDIVWYVEEKIRAHKHYLDNKKCDDDPKGDKT